MKREQEKLEINAGDIYLIHCNCALLQEKNNVILYALYHNRSKHTKDFNEFTTSSLLVSEVQRLLVVGEAHVSPNPQGNWLTGSYVPQPYNRDQGSACL